MKRFSLLYALAATMALTSCDVHEFPEDPPKEPLRVILDLDYSTEMPLYKVVEYPDGTSQTVSSRTDIEYRVRHTVKIFANSDKQRAQVWSRADADYTTTVFSPVTEDLSTKIEVKVPDGPYTAMVWTDYVPVNSGGEPFYNVNDFSDIHYENLRDYQGSTDWRDAFRGVETFVVPDGDMTREGVQTVPVAMGRPLGKYRIIATDVEQFITRTLVRDGQKPTSAIDARAFDFSKYKVRLVYTGYLPSAFNMFMNKPVDSSLGVSFYSDVELLSDDEACLAFDYVMVNGSEAKVDAVVQLVDLDGNLLAQSSPIRIPLVRSKLTEVRGKFLTASSSSGVTIVTEFDGEYNIEIH